MQFTAFISMLVSGIITENIVLSQSLGICPFLGVSKKMSSGIGMGAAVTFVLVISSLLSYILYNFLLVPLSAEYLQTLVFILAIAALVQMLDIMLKSVSPAMYVSFGIYLPLITTNCVVLATSNSVILSGYNLVETIIYSLSIGLGFTLALVLMSGIREKLEISRIPKSFRGIPAALITAGIMALAFGGFAGIGG